jgi:hypothetical protein
MGSDSASQPAGGTKLEFPQVSTWSVVRPGWVAGKKVDTEVRAQFTRGHVEILFTTRDFGAVGTVLLCGIDPETGLPAIINPDTGLPVVGAQVTFRMFGERLRLTYDGFPFLLKQVK